MSHFIKCLLNLWHVGALSGMLCLLSLQQTFFTDESSARTVFAVRMFNWVIFFWNGSPWTRMSGTADTIKYVQTDKKAARQGVRRIVPLTRLPGMYCMTPWSLRRHPVKSTSRRATHRLVVPGWSAWCRDLISVFSVLFIGHALICNSSNRSNTILLWCRPCEMIFYQADQLTGHSKGIQVPIIATVIFTECVCMIFASRCLASLVWVTFEFNTYFVLQLAGLVYYLSLHSHCHWARSHQHCTVYGLVSNANCHCNQPSSKWLTLTWWIIQWLARWTTKIYSFLAQTFAIRSSVNFHFPSA